MSVIKTILLSIIIWCLAGSSVLLGERLGEAHLINLSKDPVVQKSVSTLDRSGWVKIDNNILIGSYNENWVEAYSLKTQSPLWWLPVDSLMSIPAVSSSDSKFVYLAFIDGTVMKVETKSSKVIWQVKLDSHLNRAMTLSVAGLVCFSATQKLYLLDINSGEKQWVYDPAVVTDLLLDMAASPVVKDNEIFIGLSDGKLQSIDLSSGNLLWSIDGLEFSSTSRFKDVVGDIVVVSDTILFTRADGYVFCFKYSSSEQTLLWKDKLTVAYSSKLSVKDPSKYIVSSSGGLFFYNIKDGTRTKQELYGTNFYIYETQSYLFALSSEGVVQAVKDGRVSFIKDLQTHLSRSTFIYNDRIYFASSHKKLYGFEFID